MENNSIKVETVKSALTLDKISKGEFQKEGTLTAQIRQTITTKSHYPSKKTASSMQSNIFSNDDFGFATQDFESVENRVAFIPVPANATQQKVEALLADASSKGACIYKALSNAPILDENQEYAVAEGLGGVTRDTFADRQAVRYSDGTMVDGVDVSGQLILDNNGNVQYRRTFFYHEPKADMDLRGTSNVYLSAAIKAELAGASSLAGQTI